VEYRGREKRAIWHARRAHKCMKRISVANSKGKGCAKDLGASGIIIIMMMMMMIIIIIIIIIIGSNKSRT
jgi:hypothetical protein